ncbi:hypothetical protein [Paenibacillus sp. OSY-SE]|uniref:hypothetical protein n=1 Tax=Paenibacillus sp. OSY-SE TaxID=1196323 RepID=UPI0002EEBB76|nr:hypothetical protein [Paenibacillus sp. OSY-SE]
MALPLLFGAWLAGDLMKAALPQSQDLHLYVHDFHKVKHSLSLVIPIVLGILFVRRDIGKVSYEWMAALPGSSMVIWSAKWVAGFVYMSLFTVVMAVVYVYFAVSHGIETGIYMTHVWTFVSHYEMSYLITLVLGMALAACIRHRVVYLIGLCGWMFGTYFIDLVLLDILTLPFMRLLHLNQFNLSSSWQLEAWGEVWRRQEWLAFIILAFAFVICLFVSAVAVHMRNQPGMQPLWWRRACWICIGLAVLAALPYGMLWNERYESLGTYKQETERYVEENAGEELERSSEMVFKAERTEIKVQADGDDSAVITTLLTGSLNKNADGTVPFTLDIPFRLQEVTVDGAPAEYDRQGTAVMVKTGKKANDRVTIAFRYDISGVQRLYSNGGEAITHALQDGTVLLNGNLAWYPIPGNHLMYGYANREIRVNRTRIAMQPQEFDVIVKGVERPVYATLAGEQADDGSWHFSSKQAKSVHLYAGYFIEIPIGRDGTRIVTTPSNRREAERMADQVDEAMSYFEEWLPVHPRVNQILYMPMRYLEQSIYGTEVSGNTMLISELKHHNLDNYQFVRIINSLLFGDDALNISLTYDEKPTFVMELRSLFTVMHTRDKLGLDEQESQRSPYISFSKSFRGEEDNENVKRLVKLEGEFHAALDNGGANRLKKLLAEWYERFNGLHIDYYGNADYPPEKYPIITIDMLEQAWERVSDDE